MIPPDVLRGYPYFKWATEDSLKTLSMVCEEVAFRSGQEIFKEGDPANFMYVLTKGKVEIQYVTGSGERRTVDVLGEGDLVVWSAVVEPYVTTSFGVARTDCEAFAIDAARLRQLMAEDCDLGNSVMLQIVKILANRLKGARAQIARLE